MGGEGKTFSTLLSILESAINTFPDKRKGKNKQYSMRDGGLSGFSVFFMQCPSFLSHQELMQQQEGKNNARTVFGVEQIPTDPQIRNLLDPVDPQHCFPVFGKVRRWLEEKGLLERQYQSSLESYLLAMDGTWFHSSEAIHCPSCLHKDHRDGRRTYYHSAITPVLVKPGNNRVISLEPEFIQPQDGQQKQDCERNAAKRWIAGAGSKYVSMGITLLGDDLYCNEPFCEDALERCYHFIFTCKSSSHKYLYEWIEEAEVGVDIGQVIHKRWTGKERLYYRYRFMNDVPLRDGKDVLRVNWFELVILDKEGNVRKRHGFATDYLISRENVVDLVECGRSRWKIENEHNNTLKTKGYNLEHNFGHGDKYLSNLLLTFNLIAFLFHTVLEFFDKRYALLRKSLRRRQTFFEDIRSLTRYWCFDGWDDLLMFMLRGLKLPDPGG
jgi:hypothetical protein